MNTVGISAAKAKLSKLINRVESGEVVVISRYGHPVAKMAAIETIKQPFPLKRLAEFHKRLPVWSESSTKLLRELRDAE